MTVFKHNYSLVFLQPTRTQCLKITPKSLIQIHQNVSLKDPKSFHFFFCRNTRLKALNVSCLFTFLKAVCLQFLFCAKILVFSRTFFSWFQLFIYFFHSSLRGGWNPGNLGIQRFHSGWNPGNLGIQRFHTLPNLT